MEREKGSVNLFPIKPTDEPCYHGERKACRDNMLSKDAQKFGKETVSKLTRISRQDS